MNAFNGISALASMTIRPSHKETLQKLPNIGGKSAIQNETVNVDQKSADGGFINLFQSEQRLLNFSVDRESGVQVLSIIDKAGNLIRQVPS